LGSAIGSGRTAECVCSLGAGQDIVVKIDADQPVYDIASLESRIEHSLSTRHLARAARILNPGNNWANPRDLATPRFSFRLFHQQLRAQRLQGPFAVI